MVSTEKIYDMLPMVVELYDKLDLDKYIKKVQSENKNKKDINTKSVGIEIFKHILKNTPKVKIEVFEIVAIFEGKEIEEIKAQNFMLTINALKDLFSDKDATDFFKQAMG